jgi:hypothetical protein
MVEAVVIEAITHLGTDILPSIIDINVQVNCPPSQTFYTIDSLSVTPSDLDEDPSEPATLVSERPLSVSGLLFAASDLSLEWPRLLTNPTCVVVRRVNVSFENDCPAATRAIIRLGEMH